MPPLTDPAILARFASVLSNWRYAGYITVKDVPSRWIARNLVGMTLKDVGQAMYLHIQSGGIIDQVAERRPEWSEWPCHFDFRLTIAARAVYIETVLQDDNPNDPTLHVVSIHDV